METEILSELARLAEARRVVVLRYRQPGVAREAEYHVEPYRLHRPASGPVVHAWQLSPDPDGRSPWRDFRLDRILSLRDAGESFDPRITVTIAQDLRGTQAPVPDAGSIVPAGHAGAGSAHAAHAVWSDHPIVALGAADEYLRHLEAAMLDGEVTPDEFDLAEQLAGRLEFSHRKAVHARVFASVLHEVLHDGRVSHRDEVYLQQVRELLNRLGWSP